jgi:hypothetical protein
VIADPVAEALAHAPADAPVLAVLATDAAGGPGATLARLAQRFPGIDLVLGQAQATLGARLGLDYATELRPLLRHPLVLWSAEGLAGPRFAAWVVRDGAKLGELLEARKASGALAAAPPVAGYARYTHRSGRAYARRGPLLVSAPDLARLEDVLRRRQAGRGQWSPRLLRERGLGLAEGGAVARVALDARALVARGGADLPRVPWVAALERAALTVTPEDGGLRVHARASTDARELAPDDVPIAAGVEPPETRGSGPLVAAVRDGRQTLGFVRRVVDQLDPKRLDGLRQAEEVLARFARVSVQGDLVDRLAGSATLTSRDGRTLTLRADLDRPGVTADALERLGALARLGGPLASLAGIDLNGIAVAERARGTYVITQNGKLLVALAIVEGALVASTDPGADFAAAARAPAARRPPTAGAFRATIDAELLTDQLVRLGLPAFARGALAPLGGLIVTARGERELFDVQIVVPVAG